MVEVLKKKQRTGFTIVELIVVIAVIAILAGIVIVSYGAWRNSIATSSLKSDLAHAASAMESARGFSGASSASGYPTALPSSFSPSQNNTIVLTSADVKSYCIDGTTSTNASIKYYIDNLTQSNGASSGTCASRTNVPTPTKVTNITIATTSTEVDLTWDAASPNYASQYTIQCAEDPAFITNLLTETADGGDTSSAVDGTNGMTTYYCRLRGENAKGVGVWSDTVSADTQAYSCADTGQAGTYPNCYDIN